MLYYVAPFYILLYIYALLESVKSWDFDNSELFDKFDKFVALLWWTFETFFFKLTPLFSYSYFTEDKAV